MKELNNVPFQFFDESYETIVAFTNCYKPIQMILHTIDKKR